MKKYLSLGGLASLFAFGLGLLVDLYGARTVIAESISISETLLPFVGFGIIIAVSLAALVALDQYLKNQAIRELDDLVTSGEELLTWGQAFQSQLQSQPQSSPQFPFSHQSNLRYCILLNKYRRWLRESKDSPSVGDSLRAAAECAETLRAYGGLRGWYRIWRERRRWNKITASPRTND